MTVRPWHLVNKNNYTTQDIADERLAICKECPFFIEAPQVCKKCGCFMVAKTKLKKAKCPVGKW
jgi:hypothetical protein